MKRCQEQYFRSWYGLSIVGTGRWRRAGRGGKSLGGRWRSIVVSVLLADDEWAGNGLGVTSVEEVKN